MTLEIRFPLTSHEPMAVAIVSDPPGAPGRGTHPVPPIDASWSPLDKLRWHAGVVVARTGLTIRVTEGVPSLYGLNVGRTSIGASFSYDALWVFLTGIEVGAEEAQAMP